MLEAKTRGNLDDDEARMLKEALSSLKMAYVQVRGSQAAPPPEPAPTAPPPEPGEPTTAEREIVSGEGTEKKEPKFHKKYD